MKKQKRDGFTLVEMLTVVAIIGTLAAVASPVYLGFVRRAKTAEAPTNLAALYQAAAAYTGREFVHEGPAKGKKPGSGVAWGFSQVVRCTVISSGRVPDRPAAEKQHGHWEGDAAFDALGFTIPSAVYFSYQIRARGGRSEPASCMRRIGPAYTFSATGDLDGDGDFSTFEIAAGLDESLELYRSPGFYIEDELE